MKRRSPTWRPRRRGCDAQPVRYLHPERTAIHFLDKPISFDDAQDAVYRLPAPLIVVGQRRAAARPRSRWRSSSTSKAKSCTSRSRRISHSNARDLYYASGFEREEQEVAFLSYREFVESIRVPTGREAGWREFCRLVCAHAPRPSVQGGRWTPGVRGNPRRHRRAQAGGVLSREDYLALGVRQSIFPAERTRPALRSVREIPRLARRSKALRPEPARARVAGTGRAALRLRDGRRSPGPHDGATRAGAEDAEEARTASCSAATRTRSCIPTFSPGARSRRFSGAIRQLAERQELRVLTANFRNGPRNHASRQYIAEDQASALRLDRPREQFPGRGRGRRAGQGHAAGRQGCVEARTGPQDPASPRSSPCWCMRDEDKASAREYFSTPLLFSIHEAKGLEYENIVLYRFVSGHRARVRRDRRRRDAVGPRSRRARLPPRAGQERQVARRSTSSSSTRCTSR